MRIKMEFSLIIALAYIVDCISGQSSGITFHNVPPSLNVNETAPIGNDIRILTFTVSITNPNQTILTVTCTSLNSQDACETFGIMPLSVNENNWNGYLYLTKGLDYLRTPVYTIRLTATAGQLSQSTDLMIIVAATRYRPPQFVGKIIFETAERATASNISIAKFVAQSTDRLTANFPIRYRIITGQFSLYFNINEETGDLTNTQPLLSSDSAFSEGMAVLQIEAAYLIGNTISWNNESTSRVINATIYLSGSNANAPFFDNTFYNGSVKETASIGTFVDTVFLTVTDSDKSLTAASFSLSLDKETDKFDVTPKEGFKITEARISVKDSNQFSYNDGPRQYTFNVIARETLSSEKKSSQATVTVNLVQVNRYAPTFFQNPYVVNVSETAQSDQMVVEVKAWDRDVGPIFGNESIKYRIAQGPSSLFRMNEAGLLTVARCRNPGVYPCLDYEREDFRSIRLVVFAMDVLGEGLTSSATVTVNLINENDNPPIFTLQTYMGSIDDNSTILTLTPSPIKANDADGNPITYTIRGGNDGHLWTINPSTGILTPTRPILYSFAPINGSFNLVIQASDGLPSHDTLANVIINVKPINRYPPVFTQDIYITSIPKTTPPGTPIIKVTANDQDPPNTPGGNVTYRIISGSTDIFNINTSTGDIILGVPLSLDSLNNYTLKIEATDQGEGPLRNTAQVIIIITSESLFIPSRDIHFRDDSPINTIVTTISATTSVQTPVLQYTFLDPEGFDINMNKIQNFTTDDKEMFKINASNGVVQVNKPLNFERVPNWMSVVQVLESSSSLVLTATGTLIIRMIPSNKKPPIFGSPWSPSTPFYSLIIQQGSITKPEVATFSAISPNQSLTITYQLNDPKGNFELIAPSSGIIKQIKPIFVLIENYTFMLIAKDNGIPPLSSTATINVIINANNLYPPEFNKSAYTASIYENAAAGSSVIQVHATDGDTGDYGTVQYTIDNSVNNLFSINNTNGLISVAYGATFNAARHPFIEFYATASDSPSNPSQSKYSTAFVNITILDINDHSPIFRLSEYRIQIVDTLPIDSFVLGVEATDGDAGINSQITYRILSGNDQGIFSILNGSIYLKQSLRGKMNSYIFNVSATDGGTPPLSSYCKVYITVISTCGSTCNPIWTSPQNLSTTIDIPETLPINSTIYTLAATNYQGQLGIINFAFQNNATIYEEFKINKISTNEANIDVSNILNYGKTKFYMLQVKASDASVPETSVLRYIIVNVIPSFNPQFPFNDQTNCTVPVTASVPITDVVGRRIIKVTATSKYPNDQVTYSILGGVNSLPFGINSQTGEITIARKLVAAGLYNFTVNAKYSTNAIQTTYLCHNSDQSNVLVSVTVYDLIPLFPINLIHFCIDNTLQSGSNVLQLNDFLLNNNLGEVIYNYSQNVHLDGTTNGAVNLKTSAAEIRGSQKLDVESRFVERPNNSSKLKAEGFPVTKATDLTLVTLNEPLSEFLSTGKHNFMEKMKQYGIICYVDASYHTSDQGTFDTSLTDVFIYVIGNETNIPIPPLQLDGIIGTVAQRSSANIVGITGAVSKWDGFNYNPVAIAIGLIIGLLLLCLLFFCLCCLWPFITKCCMSSVEGEPFISKSMPSGIVSKDWAINPQLQEQEQHLSMEVPDIDITANRTSHYGQDFGDGDILQTESYRSGARREDSAMVDGMMSNEGLQPMVPAGYVHIEAPLAPSRNASAMGAADGVKSGNTFMNVKETMLQESYEKETSQAGRSTYANEDDFNRQTLKSRIRREEFQGTANDAEGPVQLNDVSNIGSQIGATLIKAEPVGGMTQVQNIISGSEPVYNNGQSSMAGYDYSNYAGTSVIDPSRSNMAYSNEVMFTGLRPVSHYEEMGSATMLHPSQNDLVMNPMNGGTRQEAAFMERFEETRFL